MRILVVLWSFVFAALLLFSRSSQGQQSPQLMQHHVSRAVTSGKSAPVTLLPSGQRMNLSIVLPLRNQSELTGLLGRLYDPSNPEYRHFLSVEQFKERFGPAADDYQAVVDFARANGFIVATAPANRMIVPISGTVEQINKAFNLTMKVYRHPTENRTFYSPDREPQLALSVPVAHVTGLSNFSIPRSLATRASLAAMSTNSATVGSGPGGSYLASDMRAAYYNGTELTGSGQAVGHVEFDGYQISDVASSFNGNATASANGSNYILSYTPVIDKTTYNIQVNNVLLDGANGSPCQLITSTCEDSEQVLDIVQAIGMAPGLSQVRVYIGDTDADVLNLMASENIAKQLSISWTWSPDDPSVDDEFFLEFAAQGQPGTHSS